jgi:hypothetical protein
MSLFTQYSIRTDPSRFVNLTIVVLRQWLDRFEIDNPRTAHVICKLIPSACPFERTVSLFHSTFHIPALCKLNPLYNQLMSLRFRALSYLDEVCGEDVTQYIA